MWELDHKEGWAPKNWYFQIVVLEKTLLDSKEIKSINSKGNQPWTFIGRTDAETETPMLGHLMQKATTLEKTLMLEGKGERDDRGWGGWMASLTRCTWVWANCGRQWSTGKPGVLQSMGWQSDATEWLHNNKSIWQYMTLGTTLLIMPFISIYHLPSNSPRLAPCPQALGFTAH